MMDQRKRKRVRIVAAVGGVASLAAGISDMYTRPVEGQALLWGVVGVVMLFASYYLGKWDATKIAAREAADDNERGQNDRPV